MTTAFQIAGALVDTTARDYGLRPSAVGCMVSRLPRRCAARSSWLCGHLLWAAWCRAYRDGVQRGRVGSVAICSGLHGVAPTAMVCSAVESAERVTTGQIGWDGPRGGFGAAGDPQLKDSSVKRWSAFHALLYRLTRGRIGRRLVDNDILLLTTRGHRTGEDHTVPLLYLGERDRFVVIASYGGRPHHPAWYKNLLAEPAVQVQVRSRRLRMIARTAGPEERERWWPRIVSAYDGYAVYQSRTDREIPVVILEPVEQS